jgi:hypothetical protein
MANKKNIHTVFNSERQRWENKQEGNPTPVSTHRTKANAEQKGRSLAKAGEGEHLIHKKDGPIQRRNSYGADPFPPRG